jgi:repressor LexA
VKALERKGLILREPGTARSIRFPDGHDAEDGFRLSVMGVSPAGFPAEAIPWSDEFIVIGKNAYLRPEELFAVRVSGDSMIGAAIVDGDLLIVRKACEAKNEAIVVARVDGEVTVKRFMREGEKVYLHPENPKYDDIRFMPWQEVEIEGIVVGVIRNLE